MPGPTTKMPGPTTKMPGSTGSDALRSRTDGIAASGMYR